MKTPFLPTILATALFSQTALATVVTNSTDEDNGSLGGGAGISLREAVKYSASGSIITFSAALSGQTIRLTGGVLQIFKSLTIDASSLPGGLTLSADRTGNGITADDTYVLLCGIGDLVLNSLTLTGANCGESAGCIKIYDKAPVALTLDHCTLTGNSGYHGAALWAQGLYTGSSITIRNSTFSRNSAVKGAAGINSHGFAVTIQNSTFTGNSGGAVYFSNGTLSINHATLSGNTAFAYAGINVGSHSNNNITIQNTICAGNRPTNKNDFAFTGTNNLFSGDALLAPLGNYGGPTHTMPPLPNPRSSAIDSASYPPAFATDQRGFLRQGKPDIGAVEYQTQSSPSDLARFWRLDFDGDGSPYGTEQALGTDPLSSDAADTRNLTRPTFSPAGHPVLSFGITTNFASGTRWILERSPDLTPGSFTEIYRATYNTSASAPGISFVRTATSVTVTDENPLPGGGFYRFGARLGP